MRQDTSYLIFHPPMSFAAQAIGEKPERVVIIKQAKFCSKESRKIQDSLLVVTSVQQPKFYNLSKIQAKLCSLSIGR